MTTIVRRATVILAGHGWQRMDWRTVIGKRLTELRRRAHGGRGYSQLEVAKLIKKTPAYINRLENHMAKQNPSIKLLDQLCALYGVPIAELFAPLVHDRD